MEQAKHSLESLIKRVRGGETITITEGDEAIAKLIAPAKRVNLDRLRLEVDLLEIQVADDFDQELELVPDSAMARYNAFVEEHGTFNELFRSSVPLDPRVMKLAEDLVGDFAVNLDDPLDPDER